MKLRHAAALALVGWYLMAPPVTPCPDDCGADHQHVDTAAPLSKWKMIESFDTAEGCHRWQHQAELKLTADTYTAWTRAHRSECIATDDPRLKSN
jgi:hypothetical protein